MCKKTSYHGTSNTQIDSCIRPLIRFLKDRDYDTVASCCGHGKYPVTVVVKQTHNGKEIFIEAFTQTKIPRNRRFYRKDEAGFYYIPEASLPSKPKDLGIREAVQ